MFCKCWIHVVWEQMRFSWSRKSCMLSSFLSYFTNLEEGTVRSSGKHGVNSSNMEGSRVAKVIKTIAISDFLDSRSFDKPKRPDSSINREQEPDLSGLGYYKDHLHQKGLYSRLPILSQLPKVKALYQIKSRPERSGLAGMLNKSWSILLPYVYFEFYCIRSAISAFHNLTNKNFVGQYLLACSQSQYFFVWDVKSVLQFNTADWDPNAKLSKK